MTTVAATQAGQRPFYVTGGTLPTDAASYVVRRADADLLDGLLAGEFCYVLNTRQMGKSSLMIRTAGRLREEGVAVAVLDLTAVGQNLTAEQWYDGLLVSLGEQLHLDDELDDFWSEHRNLGPLQRFFAAVGQVVLPALGDKRLVVFVDEIDAVRSLPFSADEFFAGVRECYNRRTQNSVWNRLVFCLLGVATPADLITDTRMSPFNVGRRIIITDFTPQEAAPLAQGLGEHGAALLARALFWTSGHPYMTQRLCRAIAEEPGGVTTARQVDALCERLFLTKQARDTDDNLAFVRNRLLRSEADLAALLDLYTQVRAGKRVKDDETNPLTAVLRLSGVAKVENGLLKVRNRIYDRVFDKEWVLAHMPDAELRRQRAAYRRGVLRAAAVFGSFAVALCVLAFVAFREAQRANAEKQVAKQATSEARAERTRAVTQGRKARRASQQARTSEANARTSAAKARLEAANAQAREKEAKAARRDAEASNRRALHLAEAQRAALTDRERALQQAKTASLLARKEARRAQREAEGNRRNLYASQMARAQQAYEAGIYWRVAQVLDELRPHPGQKDLRGWEWRYLWRQTHPKGVYTFPGYKNIITGLAISADGRMLATGDDDRLVKIWSLPGRRLLATLRGHEGALNSVAFSPDGRLLASGGMDRTARVWQIASGREIARIKNFSQKCRVVKFSPNGRLLAAGSHDGGVRLWDVTARKEIAPLPTGTQVGALAFSPDSKVLIVGHLGGAVQIWDLAAGVPRQPTASLKTQTEGVCALALAPDGNTLATGSWDKRLQLWDLVRRKQIADLPGHTNAVLSLSFSSDGKRLASASVDSTVRLWDVATRSQTAIFYGHRQPVEQVAFLPNSVQLASAGKDATVQLWTFPARPEMTTLQIPEAMSWLRSPDAQTLIWLTPDGALRRTDLATGRVSLLRDLSGAATHLLGFTNDGRQVLTLSRGAAASLRVKCWDLAAPYPLPRTLFVLPSSSASISAAPLPQTRFSRGILGIIEANKTLTLWDVARRRSLGVQKLDALPQAWDISADGNTLVLRIPPDGTGSWRLLLRDIPSGSVASLSDTHREGTGYALSPRGGRLVVNPPDFKTPWLYRLAAGARCKPIARLTGHSDYVSAIVYSPDGKILATGSSDRTVRLWDAATGRLWGVLDGHTATVLSIAFSPDGKTVATGGSDRTVRFWNLATRQEIGSFSLTEQALMLEFSPDNNTLLVGEGKTLHVWRAAVFAETDDRAK